MNITINVGFTEVTRRGRQSQTESKGTNAMQICELGHAICMGHALYIYTITDYVHPERLLGAFPISGSVSPFFVGLIVACGSPTSAVQGFFSFRIYTLSNRLYIPILSWTMSLMRLAAHTVMGVKAVRMASWASYEAQWRPLLTAIWIVSATNDVLITTTTVAVVDKIILWTVVIHPFAFKSDLYLSFSHLPTNPFSVVWLAFYAVEARASENPRRFLFGFQLQFLGQSDSSLEEAWRKEVWVAYSRYPYIFRPLVHGVSPVTAKVHWNESSRLGNQPIIALNGNPANAGAKFCDFLGLFGQETHCHPSPTSISSVHGSPSPVT
ncbi:hypothetical protein B0H16DRAFT_1475849 [Mycena metata]|uniref:Uncharacterized protein n=1 Tax=Mycena metata TaxID=1033252 RepID=A0AAD7HCY3_9AGAR|nr:hypothetical protein B0H16DRAFT_1475849 [Mycena metata]